MKIEINENTEVYMTHGYLARLRNKLFNLKRQNSRLSDQILLLNAELAEYRYLAQQKGNKTLQDIKEKGLKW